ncbi:MAG: hypothetical protein AABY22_01265 [Nanoarchaeota archaeon]
MLIEKSPKSLVQELEESFEKEDHIVSLLKKKIAILKTDKCTLEIRLNQARKKIRREKIISILLATAWGITMFLWIFFL